MNSVVPLCCLLILNYIGDGLPSESLGSYMYKELGCREKNDSRGVHYDCPDFQAKDGTCAFKGSILKTFEYVDPEILKGSCHTACRCGRDGLIQCALYDCPIRLKSGCSHFKYSVDSCCPIDSVCGPIAECEIEGISYQEGNIVLLKNKCEICACDYRFELKSPFCRPRKCLDQAVHTEKVGKYGAPAFFKDENCCPSFWISDEGQEIVKINGKSSVNGSTCKFGDRGVPFGHGFKTKTKTKSYGSEISLVCECSMPPLLICKEEI